MSDLKPCPFCGGSACLDAATSKADDGTLIEYPGCEGRCAAAVGSVEVWESRPIEDRLRRELDEAREAIRRASRIELSPDIEGWYELPAVRAAMEREKA